MKEYDLKTISSTNEEKIDYGKRLTKPLPTKPLPLPPDMLIIDDSSRNHILKLLYSWLNEFSIPINPWSEVLFNIAINLFEKLLNANSSFEKNNEIWLQIFSAHDPIESKFLTKVFHGEPLNNGTHSLIFPIGGTIRIYGLNDTISTKNLTEIVYNLIYLIHSLYLETFIMRDNHVKLIISAASVNWTPLKNETISKMMMPNTKRSSDEKSTSSNIFFSWFKKISPNNYSIITSTTPSIFNENSAKKRFNPLNVVGETLKQKLSLTAINRVLQPPNSPSHQPTVSFDIRQGDPHRFFKLKLRIENASISSSPNCHFPYPVLLDRLEAEEDMLVEQKRLVSLYGNPYPPSPIAERHPPTFLQRRGSSFISTLSQNIRRNSIFTTSTDDTTNLQLPQSITAYTSLRTQSLLAESKKGLEHLLLETTSLKSFKRHQSITIGFTCFPIGCPDRPCLGPILSTIDYFKYQSPEDASTIFPNLDQSLSSIIRHWCSQSSLSCQIHINEQSQFVPGLLVETPASIVTNASKELGEPITNNIKSGTPILDNQNDAKASPPPFFTSPKLSTASRHCSKFHGCNQLLMNHVYSFAHGKGKINVYFSTESHLMANDDNKIITWLSCQLCDANTMPTVLSKEAGTYSFAKYLELTFYSTKFASPEPFCEHTMKRESGHRSLIVRCFLYNAIIVRFMHEDAKCYEVRLPRIQLTPGISEINKLTFASPRMSILTLKEWKHKSAERDVGLFFQTIRAHLDLLQHYTIAEYKRKTRSQQDPNVAKHLQMEAHILDIEIKALSKRLDIDHEAMRNTLNSTNVNELNDFRRYFAIQSESIIGYLTDWQEEKCSELTDVCEWDRPDYISSKKIHCFPGSSVLVREDEPTSIIAYTLSSNDYLQELLHNDEATEDNDGEYMHEKNSVVTPAAAVFLKSPAADIEATPSYEARNTNQSYTKKRASPTASTSSTPSIIDGYYSSIERKYISPSTGTTSETASFRTMITEVVKSSVAEVSLHHSRRLEDLKSRFWTKRQEETKLEKVNEKELLRKLTERTLMPLAAVEHQEERKEVKMASYFYQYSSSSDQFVSLNKKIVSPHVKHKFVHEGIEFTCIVYYAKEFENLRRQCDINQLMIQSLSRCRTWSATGGKSKSHFYKAQDDRFVIKEMMNAWNMAEKDAFLKFAPKYFQHMKKSVDTPSVLAKIFGFFTIRMKNVMDKKTIFNLDVLVMEHLFFNQKITKRFDLKGIQDRQTYEVCKQRNDTTLWDGDWLNEFRTSLPVHEQSKAMMELAIRSDTEFLAKCNIMDYSLLVGIDQERFEMSVGIVDFIGAYTWYKKIESKSKSTLQPRKEVTIVPPDQYKSRFCREIFDYFIPVPGKFDLVVPSDTLPSLLI